MKMNIITLLLMNYETMYIVAVHLHAAMISFPLSDIADGISSNFKFQMIWVNQPHNSMAEGERSYKENIYNIFCSPYRTGCLIYCNNYTAENCTILFTIFLNCLSINL